MYQININKSIMKKNIYNPANLQKMIENDERSLINDLGNVAISGIAIVYGLFLQHADFLGKFYFILFGK